MQRTGTFSWEGDYEKPWGGCYSISLGGITFNEGSRPFNFTVTWRKGLFVYVFLNGKRWTRHWFYRSK